MPVADFEKIAERLRRSLVRVAAGGSGIVWDAQGHIVTNAHVVRGEKTVDVSAANERREAQVIWHDRARDLAVLYTAPLASVVPAVLGDSSLLRPGQLVLAAGNPLGITGAVTAGVIHAAGPLWIQADIRLAPGNSGGILADASGCVIGITAMIVNGLAFAVPSNDAATLIQGVHLRKTA
ncbi:MAG TPA: trypsin-like peptidase domain-containing protein [Bryobacteraceae bacterium]|nr:trypsin-like peptidase domain-containing protein [Bryobacteraceae bacterium]